MGNFAAIFLSYEVYSRCYYGFVFDYVYGYVWSDSCTYSSR